MMRCPVPGCPSVVHSAVRMREHFMYRHLFSWIAGVQEGRDPLPRCDLCGMHMPAGQILRHQRKKRCNWNTQMRWKRRDVAITSRYEEAEFSLTVEDDAECIDGVNNFYYLGRILDPSDDDWPGVLQNFRKARRVWRQPEQLPQPAPDPAGLPNITKDRRPVVV